MQLGPNGKNRGKAFVLSISPSGASLLVPSSAYAEEELSLYEARAREVVSYMQNLKQQYWGTFKKQEILMKSLDGTDKKLFSWQWGALVISTPDKEFFDKRKQLWERKNSHASPTGR